MGRLIRHQFSQALREFRATEANITKLGRIWRVLKEVVDTPTAKLSESTIKIYEDRLPIVQRIISELPAIDARGIPYCLVSFKELWAYNPPEDPTSEMETLTSVRDAFQEQKQWITEYYDRYRSKRRGLLRTPILKLSKQIELDFAEIAKIIPDDDSSISGPAWDTLKDHVSQMAVLIRAGFPLPPAWNSLTRHLRFARPWDFSDIRNSDWPAILEKFDEILYSEDDPLPKRVSDLSETASLLETPEPEPAREDPASSDVGPAMSLQIQSSRVADVKRPEEQAFKYAPGYGWVEWEGQQYRFTPSQREVVQYIHECRLRGIMELTESDILRAIDKLESKSRLRDIFKPGGKLHPAWGTLIQQVEGTKDLYRLKI